MKEGFRSGPGVFAPFHRAEESLPRLMMIFDMTLEKTLRVEACKAVRVWAFMILSMISLVISEGVVSNHRPEQRIRRYTLVYALHQKISHILVPCI